MDTLIQALISNAIAATVLAFAVLIISRILRNPAVAHTLWLVVLVKLITPPIFVAPIVLANLDVVNQNFTQLDSQVSQAPTKSHDDALIPTSTQTSTPRKNTAIMRLPGSSDWQMDWRLCLIAVWFGGSLIWISTLVYRVLAFRSLLDSAHVANHSLMQRSEQLCRSIGIRKCPPILMLDARISPVVWPFAIRATIVLPVALFGQLKRSHQDSLIAHELAHIHRRDHWVRLLEILCMSIFWWHPALWLIRQQLHEMEEQCCDSEVIRITSDFTVYARALVDAVAFLQDAPTSVPLGTTGVRPKSTLKTRIEMIMNAKPIAKRTGFHLAATCLFMVLVLPFAVVVQAQDAAAVAAQNGKLQVETNENQPGQTYVLRVQAYVQTMRVLRAGDEVEVYEIPAVEPGNDQSSNPRPTAIARVSVVHRQKNGNVDVTLTFEDRALLDRQITLPSPPLAIEPIHDIKHDEANPDYGDTSEIVGRWMLDRVVRPDGLGQNFTGTIEAVVTNDIWSTYTNGNFASSKLVSAHPTLEPKRVSFIGRSRGDGSPELTRGLYRLDGDVLEIVTSPRSDQTEIAAYDEPFAVRQIWKRIPLPAATAE